MHLQQTKDSSRETGGPQYYLHGLAPAVKDFLRRRGACRVVLHTPYGIAPTPFMAVSKDRKLDAAGRIEPGKVGHDRVQRGIGEAIRKWYGLKQGADFARIEVVSRIHNQGHFILTPTGVVYRGSTKLKTLVRETAPLSFHSHHESRLWRQQIEPNARRTAAWSLRRVNRFGKSSPIINRGNGRTFTRRTFYEWLARLLCSECTSARI
jgi:hypothetical protein